MRQFFALSCAPMLLRLVLGVTFIWAGVAKLTQYFEPSPQQQVVLQQWGVIEGVQPLPADDPETDMEENLDPDPFPEPSPEPTNDATPDATPDPAPEPATEPEPAADPAPQPAFDPELDSVPEPAPDAEPAADSPDAQLVAYRVSSTADKDEVRRVYTIALLVHKAANPSDGKAPILPAALGNGKIPVYLGWAAAATELIFGAAVLFGFFTRLSSIPLAGTMAVAMWLTQIGPAMQSGDALLGVLPQGVFEMGPGGYVYTMILWQFALLMMALALLLIGPGALSVDRMLFGAPSHIEEDDDSEGFEEDDEDVQFVKMRRGAD